MSDYFENLGIIQESAPLSPDGYIVITSALLDSVPQRICNLAADQIAFARPGTVTYDAVTKALLIDKFDLTEPLPQTEWELYNNPAIMPVYRMIGGQAIEGFLADCRRLVRFRKWDIDEEGVKSERFADIQRHTGSELPLGALLNVAGDVHYVGHPAFESDARSMMERVDAYLKKTSATLKPHLYVLDVAPKDEDQQTALPEQPACLDSSKT